MCKWLPDWLKTHRWFGIPEEVWPWWVGDSCRNMPQRVLKIFETVPKQISISWNGLPGSSCVSPNQWWHVITHFVNLEKPRWCLSRAGTMSITVLTCSAVSRLLWLTPESDRHLFKVTAFLFMPSSLSSRRGRLSCWFSSPYGYVVWKWDIQVKVPQWLGVTPTPPPLFRLLSRLQRKYFVISAKPK